MLGGTLTWCIHIDNKFTTINQAYNNSCKQHVQSGVRGHVVCYAVMFSMGMHVS